MHCGSIKTPHARIDVNNVNGKFAVHMEGPAPRGQVAKVFVNAFNTRDEAADCASKLAALMGFPGMSIRQSTFEQAIGIEVQKVLDERRETAGAFKEAAE